MRRMMQRRIVLVVCLLLAGALAGCDTIGFLAYLFNPGVKQEILAEYDGLAGKTVAVVVYADPETLFNHPDVCLQVSANVSLRLEEHIEDITLVDPQRIWRYQESHNNWDATPILELGDTFDADYILYVSLLEYATRVPGSIDLYRGSMAAQAFLYDMSQPTEAEAEVWRSDLIGAQYPRDDTGGVPNSSDQEIAYAMNTLFAEDLAKKFYDHDIDITLVETESQD